MFFTGNVKCQRDYFNIESTCSSQVLLVLKCGLVILKSYDLRDVLFAFDLQSKYHCASTIKLHSNINLPNANKTEKTT